MGQGHRARPALPLVRGRIRDDSLCQPGQFASIPIAARLDLPSLRPLRELFPQTLPYS
jgi:hypothetical protein